jgi:hypothetical protein
LFINNICYKKIENNIKNYNNIIDAIKNDIWQIIFIDNDNDYDYYKICKLVIRKNGFVLQCIKTEFMNEEICKLDVSR